MRRDHKVPFKREETVAAVAQKCRSKSSKANHGYFNITEFVEQVLANDQDYGPVKLLFDVKEGEPPAYVTYSPCKILHIDADIWHLAKQGEPEARYIVAHEIGHIMLHDGSAQAFSNDPELRIKFAGLSEYSAEAQADWFADHFLSPLSIVSSLSEDDLVKLCGIPSDLAKRQLDKIRPKPRLLIMSDGDLCPQCCNFSIVSCGSKLRCNKIGCGFLSDRYAFEVQ